MKRSPSSSSISSPSSSSSSSSDQTVLTLLDKPKTKRTRSNQKCENPDTPVSASAKRSSIYRGVTRHRWTGRFEAHLWDKTSWNTIQNKKGKQVYLGAYDNEEAAAHTYDLAALKYWGSTTILNFPIDTYSKEVEEMQNVSKEEYLASLRRRSSGFSRGVSKYRGVARHHHNGRWEARIGRVFGNKYLYLGTYNTQEEAAAAYDMAALEYRGANAVTNFDINNYMDHLKNKGLFPFSDNKQTEETQTRPPSPPPCPLPQQEEKEELQYMQQEEQLLPMDSELDWTFDMDSISLPFEDLPIEKHAELPDFSNAGFEDNIDFIFDQFETDCFVWGT